MLILRTGARLHFGLLAFGQVSKTERATADESLLRRFGGVGVMVDAPFQELRLHTAERFTINWLNEETRDRTDHEPTHAVNLRERVTDWARNWAAWDAARNTRSESLVDLPPVCLELAHALPSHSGFGSGTQLAFAVVQILQAWRDQQQLDPRQFAEITGRGRRSAIGSYGFLSGGLLVDPGKLPAEPIAPVPRRWSLPSAWRFVVACYRQSPRVHGHRENDAFASIPSVPLQVTRQLWKEVEGELVPALEASDFERFAASLWRYGCAAGECFSAVQGGTFHGAAVTRLVEQLRAAGWQGVGQSSWGPAVFVAAPSQQSAEELAETILPHYLEGEADIWIARPLNRGASLQGVELAPPTTGSVKTVSPAARS